MIPGDPKAQSDPSDGQLRELFSVLRKEDNLRTPPYMAEPETRPKKPAARSGWSLAAASVLAASIFAVLWLRHESTVRRVPYAPVASITAWRPATDFLLNTPGREMTRAVPAIGQELYTQPAGLPPSRKPKPPRAPAPLSH